MTHDVERVLADIDADHGDRCVEFLRHGVLLHLSAPCQLLVLAGPEHGRTIPLAVNNVRSLIRRTGSSPSFVAPHARNADTYRPWAGHTVDSSHSTGEAAN